MSRFFDELERQLHAAASQQAARPARWWRRRRGIVIVAVLALGVATPALSRVSGVWDPAVKRPPPARTVTAAASSVHSCHDTFVSSPAPKGAHIDGSLVAQLAVLRRPQRASDVSPRFVAPGQAVVAGSVRHLGAIGGRDYYLAGVVANALRRCGKPAPTSRPTNLCLMQRGGSGGCGIGPGDLRTRGLFGSSGRDDRRSTVAGVVPDGVSRVTVRYGTSERSFPVVDNFYGYDVALPAERFPDAITWTMRDGSRREVPKG